MGLTHQSCGRSASKAAARGKRLGRADYVIALAGNPNTGKSTVFNALTGLNQHTGNWPGKTVLRAAGSYTYQGRVFQLIDLPGTYSLLASSPEEQVARDYLCFGRPAATVVVLDATCLERNLNLALQVLEITPRVVVCVNLIDEAARKGISIDYAALAGELGVPVVPTAARSGWGLDELRQTIAGVAAGRIATKPRVVRYSDAIEKAIGILEPRIKGLLGDGFPARWLALRLLDQDPSVIAALEKCLVRPEKPPAGLKEVVLL